MGDTTWGVEVDGSRVTVVEALDGIAVAARSVSVGAVAESLEVALSGYTQKKNDPPLRVSVIAPGTLLRRLDVTEKITTSRGDFEDAVFSALPVDRDASAVAGVFFDTDLLVGDAVAPGIAAVTPQSALTEVFAALGTRRAEVVASPLLLADYDGVWLGLHFAAAEVTLLRDGRPVAFRQLRAGGLASVSAVLGEGVDPAHGERRLTDAITKTGLADPIAEAELARYLRMVAGEVRQTMEFWERQGEEIPGRGDVLVYGFAAGAAASAGAFTEEELHPILPEPLLGQLTYLNPSEREPAVLGLLAASTVGEQMPQVSFVNPQADSLLAARRARQRRLIKIGAVGVVLLGLIAFVAVPFANGLVSSRLAASELAQAEAYFEPRKGVYHQTVDLADRAAIIDGVVAQEADWPAVIELVYTTAPSGAALSRVSSTLDGSRILVVVEAQKVNGRYDELAQWLTRLTAAGAQDAWTSGFSSVEQTATYQVTFALPLDRYASARNPVGIAEEPETAPAPVDGATPAPSGAPSGTPAPSVTPAPAPTAAPSGPAAPSPAAPTAPPPTAPASPAPSTPGGDL